jgi:hypothetical protein
MNKRNPWSYLIWSQIAGLLIPGLFTAGIVGYCVWAPAGGSQGFPDFPHALLLLVEYPTAAVATASGRTALWFSTPEGGVALMPGLASVLINSMLGLACGTVFGLILKSKK